MKKKVSTIIIIIGLIIVLIPIVGQLYTSYNENRLINQWLNSENTSPVSTTDENDGTINNSVSEEAVTENYNALNDAFQAEVPTQTEQTKSTEPIKDQPKVKVSPKPRITLSSQTVLGVITIKKINVRAPIVEGVNKDNLKVGIGHIPGTAALGSAGNTALAGHRSYTFGRFFNRLDELKVGDEIIVKTKLKEFKYQVFTKSIVKPNDVSVLKVDKERENILTLITCTPIYVATHRLIIHAELIN